MATYYNHDKKAIFLCFEWKEGSRRKYPVGKEQAAYILKNVSCLLMRVDL